MLTARSVDSTRVRGIRSEPSQSADSCFLFLVTLTQRLTRNTVVSPLFKAGFTAPNHVHGVDSTTDKQATAL